MSGVEDGTKIIGVEPYVLKKTTNDLPLQSIPVVLQRDHLSGLKLADSDFRTLVLCDGWQAGPRGTPSAINTCFG